MVRVGRGGGGRVIGRWLLYHSIHRAVRVQEAAPLLAPLIHDPRLLEDQQVAHDAFPVLLHRVDQQLVLDAGHDLASHRDDGEKAQIGGQELHGHVVDAQQGGTENLLGGHVPVEGHELFAGRGLVLERARGKSTIEGGLGVERGREPEERGAVEEEEERGTGERRLK